jgi:hypothetical protein
MDTKAMECQKKNGGMSPTKIARKSPDMMSAKSPKERGKFVNESISTGKIPNK